MSCGVPVSMWRITRQPRYPLRIGASRVAPAPLANRKIAFGCGRLAIRASAPRSLCCGRVIRHRWHGRDCVAGLRLAPPPRNRLWSRALHPSANAACMAWSGYLPAPCNAASRRLPCAGGGLRSGPARLRPSTCALSVHASFRAAQASPLAPLTVSHFCASHNLGTGWILSPPSALPSAKHGGEAATRGGASADGGTRQTPRMRVRGATGGIPTKRRAPQSRMDGAPYAGCARGSRRCAAGTPSKLRADRMCRAGNAAAAS